MALFDPVDLSVASNESAGVTVTTITATLAGGKSIAAGNLGICRLALSGSRTPPATFNDSAGNTWTKTHQPATTTSGTGVLYYCQITNALSAGATLTITWTGTSIAVIQVCSFEITASYTASLNKTADNYQTSTTAWDAGTTAVTTDAVELVVASSYLQGTQTLTAGSTYTLLTRVVSTGSFQRTCVGEYKTTSSAAAQNPTGTLNTAPGVIASAVATFRAAAPAGGSPPFRCVLL